jgi:hypothetical protein
MIYSHIHTIAPHIITILSRSDKTASNISLTAPHTSKIASHINKMPPLTCKIASHVSKKHPINDKELSQGCKMPPHISKELSQGCKKVPLIDKILPQFDKMLSHEFLIQFPIVPITSLLSTFAVLQAGFASHGQQKSLSARPAIMHGLRTFVHII